jgi:hypothetical protein
MLPLRCSRPSISVSKSSSFWPSTIARRRSSGCVALISMRFMCTPKRRHPCRGRILTRCTRKAGTDGAKCPGLCCAPRDGESAVSLAALARAWRCRCGCCGRRLPAADPRRAPMAAAGRAGRIAGAERGWGVEESGGVRMGRALPLRRHQQGRPAGRLARKSFGAGCRRVGPLEPARFSQFSATCAPRAAGPLWGPRPTHRRQALHHLEPCADPDAEPAHDQPRRSAGASGDARVNSGKSSTYRTNVERRIIGVKVAASRAEKAGAFRPAGGGRGERPAVRLRCSI